MLKATEIVSKQLTQLAKSTHLQQGGETVVMGSLFYLRYVCDAMLPVFTHISLLHSKELFIQVFIRAKKLRA